MADYTDIFSSAMGTVSDKASGLLETISQKLAETGLFTTPDQLPKDKTLTQSEYDFTQRFFPIDLGENSYNDHYMVININVNNRSAYKQKVNTPGGAVDTFGVLSGELSKVDALRNQIDLGYTSSAGNPLGVGDIWIPRQTTRIKESIALFMPNTVVYSQVNQYEDVSLTGIGAGLIPGIRSVFPGVSRFASLVQAPINPRTEVIFSNTALRQFQYDFLFAPTTRDESLALEQIIKTIRFHAAPEINNLSTEGGVMAGLKGLLWIPPSEFDITFYRAGQENTAIPRINSCVLEQVDVDYAPKGIYSTFYNGYPVQIRMQLRFREVEVLHRLRVLQGF